MAWKYKKSSVLLALGAVGLMYCGWREASSPQGKLDRIVASGRNEFELREILGDWKAVCFLPRSYYYPPTDGISPSLEVFEAWLKDSLGRRIISWQDWGDVGNRYYEEKPYIKILTDQGELEEKLFALPWQDTSEPMVKCTNHLDKAVKIIRKDGKYWFISDFERIFVLDTKTKVYRD